MLAVHLIHTPKNWANNDVLLLLRLALPPILSLIPFPLSLQATEQLQQLVADHDVVFLLTDTRESRWLPSMLAAAAGKLAITAALGFDTFLVMRHGLPAAAANAATAAAAAAAATAAGNAHQGDVQPEQWQHQQRLGCYFCNDVVAPLNSTIDRTLDQQCTVARPGLAPIAGSLAVELMAAALQHPLKGHAPAPYSGSNAGSSAGSSAAVAAAGALGPVPHMVRGQLSGFGQMCMAGQAFSQCTACSDAVLQQYKEQGWPFILQVSPASNTARLAYACAIDGEVRGLQMVQSMHASGIYQHFHCNNVALQLLVQ
jgi:ubiquitin-like modifier-activating enzyme ATG7